MDQRLTASIDAYYRKTEDLLNYAPLASMAGYRNQAWQISVRWKIKASNLP